MLTIRLQRAGKKNKADFRVVLAEKTAASQKKFIEVLGSYNPHTKALGIRNAERLNYWIDEQHVEVSPTVHNLLITKDLIKDKKTKAFTIPKKEVVAEAPAEEPAPAETEVSVTEDTPAPEEAPATEEASAVVEPVVEAPSTTEAAPAEVQTPTPEATPAVEEAPATQETPAA